MQPLEGRTLLAALTIAQENLLPGVPSTTWGVNGAGDLSLQGFATDMSVNVGQTVRFKINDQSLANFHIDVYRMGYYQGNGAHLAGTIASAAVTRTVQPTPFSDANTGLVDCGNWAVSASWNVPADATSGIYMARMIRDDTGGASLAFFVVRNDASHSDILMKTSDATWQAYNEFGGNSFYHGSSIYGSLGSPSGDFPTTRAVQVSYNRPLSNRDQLPGYGQNSQPLAGEYPMVRFLEKNGYDVSYFSDVDADQRGSLLLNHRAFFSVGHDEYWSGNERANVAAARNAGVNLAFLSGNQVYWKTYYASSTQAAGGTTTVGRTLVCFKETWVNQIIDPTNPTVWTGTWRDGRLSAEGGLPENELTGTIFISDALNPFLGEPLEVTSGFASNRMWRNTSVATLQPGQSRLLGQNIVGYEIDGDVDNGSRPAGLIQLSNDAIDVTSSLVDYGSSEVAKPAIHTLTLYRAPSGALVFSAATVQWAWGLDSVHDNAVNTSDVNLQQATVNLLADMHALPTTLSAGLVAAAASTDTTRPASVITSLATNQSLVSGVAVTVSGTASDAGGGIVGGVEISTDNGVTWHPVTGTSTWTYSWIPGALGAIHVLTRAADDSGNIELPSAGKTVNVTTPGSGLSMLGGSIPFKTDSNDPNSVELGVRFTSDVAGFITGIRFYKSAANTGTHVGSLWTSTGTLLGSATFTSESGTGWQQVTFGTPVAVSAGTVYVASYHTNTGHYALDLGGFSLLGINRGPLHGLKDKLGSRNGVFSYSSSSTFPTTASLTSSNYWVDVLFAGSVAPDTTAPLISGVSAGVPASTSATLSWVTDEGSNSQVEFGLTTAYGGTSVLDASLVTGHAVSIAGLTPSTVYHYRVKSRDAAGNLATSGDFTFTTAAANSTSSLWSTPGGGGPTPAVTSAADPNAVELGVRFSASVAGSVTGLRFYKGTANTGTHLGHLWDAAGTLLATVTFGAETASGWQQATFATPVAIAAGAIYTISYYAPVGGYGYTNNYFTTTAAFTNGPLSAGATGGNGVYRYGSGGGFPTASFNNTNYWVDVIFAAASPAAPQAADVAAGTFVAPQTTTPSPAARRRESWAATVLNG